MAEPAGVVQFRARRLRCGPVLELRLAKTCILEFRLTDLQAAMLSPLAMLDYGAVDARGTIVFEGEAVAVASLALSRPRPVVLGPVVTRLGRA